MIICWIKAVWRTITTGQNWSGHTYIEKETHDNVSVQILECRDCGHISINWSKDKFPE